jgi:hypothetical protein
VNRFKRLQPIFNRMSAKASLIGRPRQWQMENAQCSMLNDRQSISGLGRFRRSMKPRSWSLRALLVALAISGSANAQGYSIDWHTIGGGGGTSANGQFSLSGTIGQPHAGPIMTNCCWEYTVIGGFWVLPPPAQPEGPAPVLSITPAATPGYVTLSWAPTNTGHVLQGTTPSLRWEDLPSGTTNPVTLPVDGPMQFFRLRKP